MLVPLALLVSSGYMRGLVTRPPLPRLRMSSSEDLSVPASEAAKEGMAATKASLLRSALLGGRGAWARPSERKVAAQLVERLEDEGSGCNLRDGTYDLICSDVEPFRASAFFLALGQAVEDQIQRGAADGALTVHSRATGGGEVGRVAHVIEDGGAMLSSLVELRSGSLPSLPLALSGTVVSTADLNSTGDASFKLRLRDTSVQGNSLQYGLPTDGGLRPFENAQLLDWIGDQVAPSGDIFERVLGPLGGGASAELALTFCDDDLMIWRTPTAGNHYFVFARSDPELWPAMEEYRRRRPTATRSPVGSAFALGMLNAFYSRAAGVSQRSQ